MNKPKNPILSSLHICGDQKSIKYLYDLVMQINKGVYSYEDRVVYFKGCELFVNGS